MIAIALLMAGQAVPVGETHGPFVIETESIKGSGFPYPVDLEITTLKWEAPSGLATYELSDNGEAITAHFEAGAPRSCWGLSRLQRLVRARPGKFGEDILHPSCRQGLSPAQLHVLRAEIASARRHFARAYEAFFRRTTDVHGLALRRCRETVFGNHGPICTAYWDEGRNAPPQGKRGPR